MNLWDSSCFKWEGAEVREAPAVLRTVNLQTQIRTRKPIQLVANVTESRLFFIGLYGHTLQRSCLCMSCRHVWVLCSSLNHFEKMTVPKCSWTYPPFSQIQSLDPILSQFNPSHTTSPICNRSARVSISFVMSVRPVSPCISAILTKRISVQFNIKYFY